MRAHRAIGCMLILAAVGCSRMQQPDRTVGTAPPQGATIAGTVYGDFVIGEPVVFANLTVFPISSQQPRTADRFITLDEGIQTGTVKIIEKGGSALGSQDTNRVPRGTHANAPESPEPVTVDADEVLEVSLDPPQVAEPSGTELEQQFEQVDEQVTQQIAQEGDQQFEQGADVNQLLVLNTSGRPLYLMPGEVISGGQQDRTIADELVIQSGDTPVPVDVFCVEQGRWAVRDVDGAVELLLAAVQSYGGNAAVINDGVEVAAERANQGEFVASVGQLNKAARIAVQSDKDQGKVWQKVAEVNAKTGNDVESSNFAANYGKSEVIERFEPYIENCQEAVLARPQIVGVAVAINGKLEAVDVFESTPLFAKLWPKLLKSYALDASTLAGQEQADQTCTVESCVAFLKQAESADVGDVTSEGGLVQTKRESKHLVSFSVIDESAEGQAAAAGGFGGAVHSTVLAH